MIHTGLIGQGYWGKIIESKLDYLSKKEFSQNSKSYNSNLFQHVEWVFIATPPLSHYNIAKESIKKGTNVFIEKPFTGSIEKANKLISLAKKYNVLLYVSNVFLFRKEIIELNLKNNSFKKIVFRWNKEGPFKDTLKNDLLYHDLYLLIHIMGVKTINNLVIFKNETNILQFSIYYEHVLVVFDYKRALNIKYIKEIKFDNHAILFPRDSQDPLGEIIRMCLNKTHNFSHNISINLKVLELMKRLDQI
jgi:hypothetical protein